MGVEVERKYLLKGTGWRAGIECSVALARHPRLRWQPP
jgi:CYTH domain-containing protein